MFFFGRQVCFLGLTLLAAFMGYCCWFDMVVFFLWKESGAIIMIWLCSDVGKLIQIPVDCGERIRQVR